MRNLIRLGMPALVVGLTLACGAPDNQAPPQTSSPPSQAPAGETASPQGNALTTPAPAAESNAAPSSTPGADMRAPAAASNAAPAPPGGTAPAPSGHSIAPGASATAPPAAAASNMMPMDVPPGTELNLILETPVSSATSKVEQVVRARLANPVVVSGMTVIPEGAPFTGTVVAAQRAGKVKGRSSVAIRFNRVTVASTPYKISTARIVRVGEATKSEDATKIGVGAGAGAIIGGIAGGKKGAAIGAGVGGGAGTGVVLATRGKDVTIPAGATVRTTVQQTVRITAPM